jgi:hypothetical protein
MEHLEICTFSCRYVYVFCYDLSLILKESVYEKI